MLFSFFRNRQLGHVVISGHEAVMSRQPSAVSRQQTTIQKNPVLITDG